MLTREPICRKCRQAKSDHCEFEEYIVPVGCVCDPLAWFPEKPHAICGKYVESEDPEYKGCCGTCQHDKACHINVGERPEVM